MSEEQFFADGIGLNAQAVRNMTGCSPLQLQHVLVGRNYYEFPEQNAGLRVDVSLLPGTYGALYGHMYFRVGYDDGEWLEGLMYVELVPSA